MFGLSDDDIELAILSEDAVTDLGLGVLFMCVAFTRNISSNLILSWIQKGTNETLGSSGAFCVDEREFYQGNYKFRQSFLQITGLACTNAGVYICSATDGNMAVNHPVTLYLRSKCIQVYYIIQLNKIF